MLTKMKLALAVCGTLAAGVGVAAAYPGGAGGAGDKAALLQKYDTNKDGKLDASERAAMRADKKAAMLAKYDTNKDGKLDASERAVMKSERAEEAFKKLDKDGNGSLSLDEFKQARMFQHHRKGLHKGAFRRDLNGSDKP
jgi:Ca2+-binding EF-hand superfamily protein